MRYKIFFDEHAQNIAKEYAYFANHEYDIAAIRTSSKKHTSIFCIMVSCCFNCGRHISIDTEISINHGGSNNETCESCNTKQEFLYKGFSDDNGNTFLIYPKPITGSYKRVITQVKAGDSMSPIEKDKQVLDKYKYSGSLRGSNQQVELLFYRNGLLKIKNLLKRNGESTSLTYEIREWVKRNSSTILTYDRKEKKDKYEIRPNEELHGAFLKFKRDVSKSSSKNSTTSSAKSNHPSDELGNARNTELSIHLGYLKFINIMSLVFMGCGIVLAIVGIVFLRDGDQEGGYGMMFSGSLMFFFSLRTLQKRKSGWIFMNIMALLAVLYVVGIFMFIGLYKNKHLYK